MRKVLLGKLLFLMVFIGIYSFHIEPQWLDVSHHSIRGKVSQPLKIAHLSDLHFGNFFRLSDRLLAELEKEKPDIILITGDSCEVQSQAEKLKTFFGFLNAPLGVYAVRGNWENWNSVGNENTFGEGPGVTLLVNEITTPREDLELFGYDDKSSGRPARDLAGKTNIQYRICLFHSPQFFDEISSHCSLSLSGHTHGGQINLPFWGPLWLPEGSGSYLQGWYQREDSRMYVSRGLGTSVVPFRFLARPELAFISVNP